VSRKQFRIGWRHFFEGKPAIGWTNAYRETAKVAVTEAQGLRWLVALHMKLINVAWDLWNHRNGVLHDSECRLAEEKLDEQVKEIHIALQQAWGRRKHVAKVKLTTILGWQEQAKRDWLWVAKGAIEESKLRQDSLNQRNQQPIHRRRSI
jgi:hypothetical protein